MTAMAAQDNAAAILEIYRLFNTSQYDAVLEHVSDDCEVLLVPFNQTFRGKEGFREFMLSFKTAFPDVTVNTYHQVACGDEVVNEFVVRGTHTGPLQTPGGTVPPTGKALEYLACETWSMRDGQVTRIRNYQDAATIMRQLGVIA